MTNKKLDKIDQSVEKKFSEYVKKKGLDPGKSFEEALKLWIKENNN